MCLPLGFSLHVDERSEEDIMKYSSKDLHHPRVPPDRDSDKDRQREGKKDEKQEIASRAPEQHKRWGRREARYWMTNGQNVFLSCHNILSAATCRPEKEHFRHHAEDTRYQDPGQEKEWTPLENIEENTKSSCHLLHAHHKGATRKNPNAIRVQEGQEYLGSGRS